MDLARSLTADRGWLDRLPGEGVPAWGHVADEGLAGRDAGIRHGLSTWVASRVVSCDGTRAVVDVVGRAVDQAHRNVEPVAILSCDIDGFGAVNQRLGHSAGDAALVEVVRRVEAVLPDGAVLGRMGGDGLVVVLRGADSRMRSEAIAQQAITALQAPISIGGTSATCGLSIDIAVFDGRSHAGPTADAVLAWSETAVYRAERAGGGRFVVTNGPLEPSQPPRLS